MMTDYTRNTLTGVLAPVNNELEKIQVSLRDKFDRDPDIGQSNELKTNLDANSNRIVNLPLPLTSTEPARLIDLANLAGGDTTINNVTYNSEVRVFADIPAMRADISLVIGNTALCKRETAGGALVEGLVYDIRASASVDGVIDFSLSNGNIAVRARVQVNNFDPTTINTNIATNATNIATNASGIATNVSAIASNAAAILANTNSIAGFTKTYWFNSSDVGTTASPITHGAGSTTTFLTNDAAGSETASYNPATNADLWNASTNSFDFTSLKIGDTVEFRIDIDIANAAAQEINIVMDLAEGTATPYTLNVNHTYFKTASSGDQITAMFRVYMGNSETRTGGARFRLTSIAATTIVVNGWFYQITEV